jgi:hypothetical protein
VARDELDETLTLNTPVVLPTRATEHCPSEFAVHVFDAPANVNLITACGFASPAKTVNDTFFDWMLDEASAKKCFGRKGYRATVGSEDGPLPTSFDAATVTAYALVALATAITQEVPEL